MNNVNLFAIFVLLICGYITYTKFYVNPKTESTSTESMLFQIAAKEKWIDGFTVMREVENSIGLLHREVVILSNYDGVVHANGKITYSSPIIVLCKEVEFTFKIGSLHDYKIIQSNDC